MSDKSFAIVFKQMKKDFPNNNVISVPLSIFNDLNNCLNAKLKLGTLIIDVICLPNFSYNTIEISEDILKVLGISLTTTCNIYTKDNIIHLGPVIGVFASNGSIRKANEQTPDLRTLELMKANYYAATILYFFSIKDIDFVNNKINGTYFNDKTQLWEKKYFPLPDVLYDRGGGALKSQKKISKYIRDQLNHDYIKKFNPQHYFDKWDVHEKLSKYKEISSYLPLTVLYEEANDIKEMFNHSAILYIKDCLGSNGRGVMRVIKMPNHNFHCSYFAEEVIEQKVSSFEDLIKIIEKFFLKKKTIVQSAINVIKLNNSNVDMRATVQRDETGNLCITAYPVRLARGNSPITSTQSGSIVYRFEDFFRDFFQYSQDEIDELKAETNRFILTIYECIEDSYGKFGEIGIDFAIDLNGQLWFIECNAKPGKDTLCLSYGEDIIRKAFLNPLEYAKYITGFNMKKYNKA